jgi:cation transporter-like permease
MQRFFRRALMVILGLVLVSLIAYFGYLLRDFQQSLHDIPH